MKKILGVVAIVALGIILGVSAAGPDKKKGPQLKIQTKAARVDASKIAPNCFAMAPNFTSLARNAGTLIDITIKRAGTKVGTVEGQLYVREPLDNYNYDSDVEAITINNTGGDREVFVWFDITTFELVEENEERCGDLFIRQQVGEDRIGGDRIAPIRYSSIERMIDDSNAAAQFEWCQYRFYLDLSDIDWNDTADEGSAGSYHHLPVEICSFKGESVVKQRFLFKVTTSVFDGPPTFNYQGGALWEENPSIDIPLLNE